jgi:hypothetical protein
MPAPGLTVRLGLFDLTAQDGSLQQAEPSGLDAGRFGGRIDARDRLPSRMQ